LAQSDSLRPDFVRKLDQPILGPLILDDEDSVVDSLKVPGAINTFLREYQREGVRFFHRQYRAGKGALLGDDMGLGKTIQVIAFLSALMSKSGAPRDKDRRQKHIAALQDSSGWLKRRELPPADATWPTALIVAPSSVV
jgi:SNF2 family DNA or RNA helicase